MTGTVSPIPFVNFKMTPTKNISSTPELVFGTETCVCLLDSLIIANQVDNAIFFSVYLLREEGDSTPSEAVEYPLVLSKRLEVKESMDLLESKSLTLQTGDTLYAYSDDVHNLFNTFISYRELTELTA